MNYFFILLIARMEGVYKRFLVKSNRVLDNSTTDLSQ
jgi:hypothetical protein